LSLPVLPITMAGMRPNANAQLPAPGADSRAVLEALGMSNGEIDALLASGAVSSTPERL
jgi:crotonobetainyl-CoA:carnitine CoA-transferase CaiB-like acyl-CoA transferase